MDELRKGSVRYTALVSLLIAIAASVALCVANVRVALADEGASAVGANTAQMVETAEEMGPWLYGEPLVAQAEQVGSLAFGINSYTAFTTSLPILKGAGFDFVTLLCPVYSETLDDGTVVYYVGFDRTKVAM